MAEKKDREKLVMPHDCDEQISRSVASPADLPAADEASVSAGQRRRRRSRRRRSTRPLGRRAAMTSVGYLLLVAGLALSVHYCLILDPTASGPARQSTDDGGNVIAPLSADLKAECRNGLLVGLVGSVLGVGLVGIGRKSSSHQAAAPKGSRSRGKGPAPRPRTTKRSPCPGPRGRD